MTAKDKGIKMTKKLLSNRYSLLTLLALATVIALTIAQLATATYELPPREDNNTAETAVLSPVLAVGGRLQLHVQFSQDWPWDQWQWQDMWTVVQWSDGKGNWFDVTGWQGNLDTISQQDGWVGAREWWAGADNLGKGPFRWLIYQKEGGKLLATSKPFYLPGMAGGTVIIEQPVSPK
jgi:hypothetical protein